MLLRVPDSCIPVDLFHRVTDDVEELDAAKCCKQLMNDFGCRWEHLV